MACDDIVEFERDLQHVFNSATKHVYRSSYCVDKQRLVVGRGRETLVHQTGGCFKE